MRSIFAVVLGYVLWTLVWLGAWAVAATVSPDSFAEDGTSANALLLAAFVALGALLSVIGGIVTAWTAQAVARGAVRALAILLLASGLFFQLQSWDAMPVWFHLPFLASLYPCTVLGGKLAVGGR